MDSRVWQGEASGRRSARHRSSLRPFSRPTPRRGQKGGLFCRPTPRRGPKGGLFCRPTPRRAPKRGLFCTVPGCAAQKAARFSPFRAARSKRRPVFHSSWVRGEKGGPFFTVPGCAAQKAARFSPFLTARRKRQHRLHSATPRGCCIGPSFRADYKTKPDTPWKSHHVPGKLRWRPKTPRQILLWRPQTPRTDSQASADVLGRALGLFSEVRSGLREQVVLERLEGARHRHTAFLALHKGSEPRRDLDRATCGRLHRVEELGRVSRLEENARLARL